MPGKKDKNIIVLDSDDDDCIVVEDDSEDVEIIHVQSSSSGQSIRNGRIRAAQGPIAAPVAAVVNVPDAAENNAQPVVHNLHSVHSPTLHADESAYDDVEIEGNLLSKCNNVGPLTEQLDWSNLKADGKRIVVFGEFSGTSALNAYEHGVQQVFVFDCSRDAEGRTDGVLFLVAYYDRKATVPPPSWPEGQPWPLWPDPTVEGAEPVGIILKKVNIDNGRLVGIETTRVRGTGQNVVNVKEESFIIDGGLYTDTFNFLTDQKVFLASIKILCREVKNEKPVRKRERKLVVQ